MYQKTLLIMTEKQKVYIFKEKYDFSFIEINPGETVVLKPNFVKESVYGNEQSWEHVITSRKVIELVSNYVAKKLSGQGKIILCDAPQTDSSFDKISKLLDLDSLAKNIAQEYNVEYEVLDTRDYEWRSEGGVIVDRKSLPGDPAGKIAFNLGADSLFFEHPGEGKFYGADYDQKEVNSHHYGDIHEYLITKSPIDADVFINLPKLKTHKKTGVTLSLKNLVGINADKNWLPHHTDGSPLNKGDQYPTRTLKQNIESLLTKMMRKLALNIPIIGTIIAKYMRKKGEKVFGSGETTIRSGNWYGNNTTWRMALDLNRCLLYGQADGSFSNVPKRYYSVVDGLIGMEGNGPMHGTPITCGLIIAGSDPVAVDLVSATMMGFDWEKIPIIKQAYAIKEYPITTIKVTEIQIESDVPAYCGDVKNLRLQKLYNFQPHFGWEKHIELTEHELRNSIPE
jgi:uncharacterized protein (DUF362 family)